MSDIRVIGRRPPGDDFSWQLFQSMCDTEPQSQKIYIWSWNSYDQKTTMASLVEPLLKPGRVLLCIRDNLGTAALDGVTDEEHALNRMFNNRPDVEFVLMTGVEFQNRTLKATNLKTVHLGGCITNHAAEYRRLPAVTSKRFDLGFMNLNRASRLHRVAVVCKLIEDGIVDQGHVTFLSQMFFNHKEFLEFVPWDFQPEHERIRQQLIDGWPKLIERYQSPIDHYNIYEQLGENNNTDNFLLKLKPIYESVGVEVVSETTCFEKSFLLTEKTLHSFYGQCLPVMIAGQGAVDLLRQQGFDMFDDILDHSYDLEPDPLLRIQFALERNRDVMVDTNSVKGYWHANKERFTKNIDIARDHMYTWYSQRAWREFMFTK